MGSTRNLRGNVTPYSIWCRSVTGISPSDDGHQWDPQFWGCIQDSSYYHSIYFLQLKDYAANTSVSYECAMLAVFCKMVNIHNFEKNSKEVTPPNIKQRGITCFKNIWSMEKMAELIKKKTMLLIYPLLYCRNFEFRATRSWDRWMKLVARKVWEQWSGEYIHCHSSQF